MSSAAGLGAQPASRLLPQEVARIEAATQWREHRVQVFDFAVGRAIVKGHRPRRRPTRHRALNAVAGLVGVPLLRAVPVHGGAASQAVELRRLAALQAVAAPVPEVLHVADDYFVMQWLGQTHLALALSDGAANAFALWQQAAQAILDVHRHGQYLSQCFGRNVIVAEGDGGLQVAGLIDFEDDPLEVMTLPEAQVRDWMIYLQSTLWQLPAQATQVDAVLDAWLQAERAEVRQLFARACRRVGWLRHLPANRSLGRDTYAVQVVAAAAHRWSQRARS